MANKSGLDKWKDVVNKQADRELDTVEETNDSSQSFIANIVRIDSMTDDNDTVDPDVLENTTQTNR